MDDIGFEWYLGKGGWHAKKRATTKLPTLQLHVSDSKHRLTMNPSSLHQPLSLPIDHTSKNQPFQTFHPVDTLQRANRDSPTMELAPIQVGTGNGQPQSPVCRAP
jgi:hypothetical protein